MGKSPHKKKGTFPRFGSKSHLKQPWIEAFRKIGVIGQACEAVNVSRQQVYDWRKEDPKFKKQFEESNIHITELIERSALNRAIVGTKKSVYQGGKKVGDVVEPSDTLAIFLLKARDPKKYRNWYNRQIDVRFIQAIVDEFAKVIHKNVPAICPHCNNNLALKPAIVRDLQALSKRLEQEAKY